MQIVRQGHRGGTDIFVQRRMVQRRGVDPSAAVFVVVIIVTRTATYVRTPTCEIVTTVPNSIICFYSGIIITTIIAREEGLGGYKNNSTRNRRRMGIVAVDRIVIFDAGFMPLHVVAIVVPALVALSWICCCL